VPSRSRLRLAIAVAAALGLAACPPSSVAPDGGGTASMSTAAGSSGASTGHRATQGGSSSATSGGTSGETSAASGTTSSGATTAGSSGATSGGSQGATSNGSTAGSIGGTGASSGASSGGNGTSGVSQGTTSGSGGMANVPILNSVTDEGTDQNNNRTVQLNGSFPGAAANYELDPNLAWSVFCYLADGGSYATAQPLAQTVSYLSGQAMNVTFPNPVPDAERDCYYKAMSDPGGVEVDSDILGPLPLAAFKFPDFLDAYYWGTGYTGPADAGMALSAGADFLGSQGLSVVRVAISPNDLEVPGANNYGISPPNCPPNQFLPCAIQLPPYQALLADPFFPTIILTAYDSTSLGQTGQDHDDLNLSFLQANAAAVEAEYAGLVEQIAKVPGIQNKLVIVDHWEGDNMLCCGSSYEFANDTVVPVGDGGVTFQQYCIDELAPDSGYTAAEFLTEEAQGMAEWLTLRKIGIAQGVAAAAAAGTPVHVIDAAEINSYQQLEGVGLPSVLYDVIPVAQPSYVTYSSYESYDNGTYEQDLAAIQSQLATTDPDAGFGIGELGAAFGTGSDYSDPWVFVQSLLAVQRAGVNLVVIWEGFNSTAGASADFGLFGPTGADRIVDLPSNPSLDYTQYLRDSFDERQGYRTPAQLAPSLDANLKIAGYIPTPGVNNCGSGCAKSIALYGPSFGLTAGSNPAVVTPNVLCDDAPVSASTLYVSPTQINIALSTLPSPWCTVSLGAGGQTGAVFGPMYLGN
jgi:hypothetical protein